ncbi:MAG: excinuclease ABC subunit UvrA, partial [Bacteroidetes bacterium]|nr:excinuclease ABC subunit UvrA [Bacteroidota bacterium]
MPTDIVSQSDYLEVIGARVHNLKNIDVTIPRNQLVVITGLSGSGKSSLAFDTIYAEGQRRYIESFSAYARQFLGNMERPDVDKITGLSPVISIEQKTVNKNPRSTVGTITEIYDFLRLLFARASEAHSYVTGEKMVRYSDDQILNLIFEKFTGKKILMLAPLIKGRKGHYRELFEQIKKWGYLRVRIDGEVKELTKRIELDRYKVHDIEIVIDRLEVNNESRQRISESLQLAMKQGKGIIMVQPFTMGSFEEEYGKVEFFSRHLMCPTSGISYDEPQPNLFSFNSPYGACPKCNGLGVVSEIDINKIIPDKKSTIRKGAITPIGPYKTTWIFKQLEAIGDKYGFTLDTPLQDISDEAINTILFGSDEIFKMKQYPDSSATSYSIAFEGIANFIAKQNDEQSSPSTEKWVQGFMNKVPCPKCNGTRLKKESLHFKVDSKNISELSEMGIIELNDWFKDIEKRLSSKQNIIAKEVLKEIRTRILFLLDVGLDYLSLNRSSRSLSGGEAQRIRLATQIGSQLVGVLYILDEPSIGLHQRDNMRLINAL